MGLDFVTLAMDLSDRTAVVTGAASGLGRAIAARLASHGAAVVVADVLEEPREGGIPTADLITQGGGRARFVRTDVRLEEEVAAAVATATETFGSLDIMCNNAGVSELLTSVAETSMDDFDRLVSVNFRGQFIGCKHAARKMIEQGRGGIIVNTASCFGLVGYPTMAVYCSTKGAVVQLTRSLAGELGQHNIRVNALCPGTIDTEMDRAQREDAVAGADIDSRTPLLLPGGASACTPDEQAAAVAFMVSDAARWMTGACLVMDGGWTAL